MNSSSAVAVLVEFMREMNHWELQCAYRTEQCIAGNMDFNEAVNVGTAEYMSIFRRYCSLTHAIPRDYHFTEPPDYDPGGEKIQNVREEWPGTMEINTEQNYSHRKRHLYRLAVENGEWRILERKVVLDNNELLDSCL